MTIFFRCYLLEKLYIISALPVGCYVQVWSKVLHPELPFLSLIIQSCYSSVGVLYSFLVLNYSFFRNQHEKVEWWCSISLVNQLPNKTAISIKELEFEIIDWKSYKTKWPIYWFWLADESSTSSKWPIRNWGFDQSAFRRPKSQWPIRSRLWKVHLSISNISSSLYQFTSRILSVACWRRRDHGGTLLAAEWNLGGRFLELLGF